MKTIKIKGWIRGQLQDITIYCDKIVGVRQSDNPPYENGLLMTTNGNILCNEHVREIEHKIKWAE